MSWEGTGAPVFRVDGVEHVFPRCVQGGRKEEWPKEVDRTRKTVLGEVVRGEQGFRFQAEYTWANLTDDQVVLLQSWDNQQVDIQVQPYGDTATLRVACWVVSVTFEKGSTVFAQDRVTLKVEALALVPSRPIPDTRLFGFGTHPKKGVIA